MRPAFSTRLVQAFALASGMALVMAAYASETHGEPAAAQSEGKEANIKPSLRPDLKAEARASEARSEGKEGKSGARDDGKVSARGDGRDLRRESSAKPESAADGKASVSMAELRDLIDQKIAEVRTKREVAPVVRLRPKPVRVGHGGGASAKPGKLAANDLHGALLPLAAAEASHEHEHGHDAPPTSDPHAAGAMGRDIHWAYSGDTGPDSWGRLKPEYQQCMLGKRQSPIDIRDGIPVQLDPIQFDYRPTAFRVIDNGHTVQVNVDSGNSIVVSGHRYELVQFHFHRPSEERINGRQYEMVAHLVHKDLDGRLAVVSVLMDQGKGHPLVQQVWNNLPLEKNIEQGALTLMDLNMLLPELRQYYTYMGSLTTPPCSEGVQWLVMKNPATMSREQIGVFAKLYPMNARPIQQPAGRLIKDGQ